MQILVRWAIFNISASKWSWKPSWGLFWTPLGSLWGGVWRLLGFWGRSWAARSRQNIYLGLQQDANKSLGVLWWSVWDFIMSFWRAWISFWSFRRPILSPPGGVFGLPNDYFGATNMRSNHHIYPVATPVHYRRSGPGGMRVAIK